MKILIAGDYCPWSKVAELFDKNDFCHVLGEIKPITEKVDYSLVNFECAVASEEDPPLIKYGPNLRCSEKGIEAIKWAGFDAVTLANNHFYDYGEKGVEKTLACCAANGIEYIGGGRNIQEASSIKIKSIVNKKVAFINCCEHEFSISTETTGGSNPLNPISLYYNIKSVRGIVDYIVIILHGGSEHYQLPTPRMQETYRFFIDAGADIVINHHQHCLSGFEYYKGKPIVYGLGNFCFDRDNKMPQSWYEGALCMIDFDEIVRFELIPFFQCKEDTAIHLINNQESFKLLLEKLNHTISDCKELQRKFDEFIYNTRKTYLDSIEPYGRLLMALRRRGIISSGLTKDRLLKIFNLINCESHLDRMRYAIQSKVKEL